MSLRRHSSPRSLLSAARSGPPEGTDALLRLDEGERIISKAAADTLVQQIYALTQGGGWTTIKFWNSWWGELRWARNRPYLAAERRTTELKISRGLRGASGSATTNQLDAESLEGVVRKAEQGALLGERPVPIEGYMVPNPAMPLTAMKVWSDASYGLSAEARGGLLPTVIEPAEANGMVSAGDLKVAATAWLSLSNHDAELNRTDHVELRSADKQWLGRQPRQQPYTPYTLAQCSMTVRDAKGTGSGWAGLTSFDWTAIDPKALGERALQKGLASRNPVALEPGRYTVILEPQAVADLMDMSTLLLPQPKPAFSREVTEGGESWPFTLGYDSTLGVNRAKLGMKVVDERLTISSDPADPMLGWIGEESITWHGVQPITWIKDGVLVELGHSRQYAEMQLRTYTAAQSLVYSYRMSGGPTSEEEMIKTTKRGLLVTRLSPYAGSEDDPHTLGKGGLTRDGLWLIENGQITKAVKNMRFFVRPLEVLNSIEQLGVPVPVWRLAQGREQDGPTPAIVPPMKVRDFSFTHMVDAV